MNEVSIEKKEPKINAQGISWEDCNDVICTSCNEIGSVGPNFIGNGTLNAYYCYNCCSTFG